MCIGVRQGYPLPSFIFIFLINMMTISLSSRENNGTDNSLRKWPGSEHADDFVLLNGDSCKLRFFNRLDNNEYMFRE